MKGKLLIRIGIILAIPLVLGFGIGIGQAFASTGCFLDTNGNWAETAICWMKDNAITNGTGGGYYSPNAYVSRAQMAVFMQKQAEIPPSTGDMYIVQSLSDLEPGGNFTSTAIVRIFSNTTVLYSTGAGTNWYTLLATVPSSLYGRGTSLKSVQVCYQATHGATLTAVEFSHYSSAGGLRNTITDATARTDTACRTYSFTTPSQVVGSDHVALSFAANFPSASDSLYVNSVTFILAPSTLTGILTAPEQEAVQEPALLPNSETMIGSNP